MAFSTISPRELGQRLDAGETVEVIDVRTPVEFREIHLASARNVPLDTLDPQSIMADRNGNGRLSLYVVCRSGSRSAKACQKFADAGYQDVASVEGGTVGCEQAGLAVVRGKKAISLERQVRIAAGLLVLLGVLLGLLVHPGFLGLSAFVGAGLVFAGVTDTCAMGMLLAKMPWNQCATDSCQSGSCKA